MPDLSAAMYRFCAAGDLAVVEVRVPIEEPRVSFGPAKVRSTSSVAQQLYSATNLLRLLTRSNETELDFQIVRAHRVED
jgi:hypothetical protein